MENLQGIWRMHENDDITRDRVRDGGGMIIVPVLER